MLDADPVGERQEQVVRQLQGRVGDRDPEQHGVVPHERVGAPVAEGEQGVREAVGDLQLRVLEAVVDPAVVDRAAGGGDRLAVEVGERLDRRVVPDEQPPGCLVVRPREVDACVTVGRVGERRDD